MPAAYTHYRFGRDVLALLPEELRSVITAHRALYDIGLHGPDIFFFYRPLGHNSVIRLGHALHTQSGETVFRRLATLYDRAPSPAARAYLLGFLCHFALDSSCHGYVGQMEALGVGHSLLETQLDRAFLVEDKRDPCTFNPTGHLKPTGEAAEVIAGFFPQITVGEVEASIRDMIRIQQLLLPTSAAKRKLLMGSTRLFRKPYIAGMVMPERESVACRQMVGRLRLLYVEAVPLAVSLLEAFPVRENPQYRLNFEGELAEGTEEKER